MIAQRRTTRQKHDSSLPIYLSLLVATIFTSSLASSIAQAKPKTLFEGYYKITQGSQHIGYAILRFRFDSKSKQFSSTSYIHIKTPNGTHRESLSAMAGSSFQPLSYQYTAQTGKAVRTIDAEFNGNTMEATVFDGKARRTVNSTLREGSFAYPFLFYLMLSKGLSVKTNFKFFALAPEEAVVHEGEALVASEKVVKGVSAYKIESLYKGEKTVSLVTTKGQVLGATIPSTRLTTELVAKPSLATKGFRVPEKNLKQLFGEVPRGSVHALAESNTSTNSNSDNQLPQSRPKKSSNKNQPKSSSKSGKSS
jgi:hypothetical protein